MQILCLKNNIYLRFFFSNLSLNFYGVPSMITELSECSRCLETFMKMLEFILKKNFKCISKSHLTNSLRFLIISANVFMKNFSMKNSHSFLAMLLTLPHCFVIILYTVPHSLHTVFYQYVMNFEQQNSVNHQRQNDTHHANLCFITYSQNVRKISVKPRFLLEERRNGVKRCGA